MAQETLYVSGAGDETNLSPFPTQANYLCVDEETPNGATDFVAAANDTYLRDLYALDNPSDIGVGDTINWIKVFGNAYAVGVPTQASLKLAWKIPGQAVVEGSEETLTQSWADYDSGEQATKPGGGAWTLTDLNNLQAGCALRRCETEKSYASHDTQIRVLVDSTPAAGWTGKISGVTNPAKVMGVAVANISKVKGVS